MSETTSGPSSAQPQSLYPHEVAPEPREEAPLIEWARYYVARAQGFWVRFMLPNIDDVLDNDREATLLALMSAEYALTLCALLKGLAGDEAYRWVAERLPDGGAGEWLWECGTELGLDMQAIRGFPRSMKPEPMPPAVGNAGSTEADRG